MAISNARKNTGHQYPLVAYQEFVLADFVSGTAAPAVKLPAGAIVIGGEIVITTAFNAGTTNTIDVGDGGDDDRYTSTIITASSLGRTALTLTGYQYTTADTIDLLATLSGTAATTGAGYLMVMYIVEGRTNEVMPDYT